MMRRTLGLCLIAMAVFGMCFSFSFQSNAAEVGDDNYFKLSTKADIGVTAGNNMFVTVTILNEEDDQARFAKCLKIIVVDPFNGARVQGPLTFGVNSSIDPGSSITKTLIVNIPSEFPDQTLAMIITVLDENSVVRGATGWGFVTKASGP